MMPSAVRKRIKQLFACKLPKKQNQQTTTSITTTMTTPSNNKQQQQQQTKNNNSNNKQQQTTTTVRHIVCPSKLAEFFFAPRFKFQSHILK